MKLFTLFILSFFVFQNGISQNYEISGTISDARTGKPLEYVTVKVADTSFGTTADKDGKYFIRMDKGACELLFSYIGYQTESVNFYVEDKNITRDIFLNPSELMTGGMTLVKQKKKGLKKV